MLPYTSLIATTTRPRKFTIALLRYRGESWYTIGAYETKLQPSANSDAIYRR